MPSLHRCSGVQLANAIAISTTRCPTSSQQTTELADSSARAGFHRSMAGAPTTRSRHVLANAIRTQKVRFHASMAWQREAFEYNPTCRPEADWNKSSHRC